MLSALSGTDIPVPTPVAICDDQDVIGAPFYLMEYVPGAVLRTAEDAAGLTPAQAGQLSRTFVRMLASIHGLDIEAAGLTGFGRPEGYLAADRTPRPGNPPATLRRFSKLRRLRRGGQAHLTLG